MKRNIYIKTFFSLTLALSLSASQLTAALAAGTEAAADETYRAFAVGPGVESVSPKDGYTPFQWALRNTGSVYRTQRQLDISSLGDIYVHRAETGEIDAVLLPPVGPSNFVTATTSAVAGIDINVEGAWNEYEQTANKRNATVALIDTGVDITHPDLVNSIWTNEDEIPGDGIDNDGNGYVDDVHGWNFIDNTSEIFKGEEDIHGTHGAGTIDAGWRDGGITGIADNTTTKLMVLKALGGSSGKGSPASVIAAIKYAEANGAQICNLSFGSSYITDDVAQAIKNSPMLFIVAAGNGDSQEVGYDIDKEPVYPASLPYDNVLTVANLMFDGTLDESSNYGAMNVDLAAPGTYILSCVPGGSYGYMSGTSMAAPMVTGAAALLYTARPELSVLDVKNVLIASAHKLPSLEGKLLSGGMLDVTAAMGYGR